MSEVEKKMQVACVDLMVTRDSMTHVPITVPAHEVEVLMALHGQENVRVLESSPGATEIDPDAEGERLTQKYGEGLIRELFGATAGMKLAKLAADHEVKPAKKAAEKTAA